MDFEIAPSFAWRSSDLASTTHWIRTIDERSSRLMHEAIARVWDPERPLFDYQADEFDLGPGLQVVLESLDEVKHHRGVALVRGLPRADLSEKQFELLTWAIGLQSGVPRPQGKATHYISAVRDAGTAYRTGTGRGYSSNAELDYHTDTSDIVFLTCYNRAVSGGMTIVSSSHAGYQAFARERPDLLDWLHQPIGFSRQGEQAPDEGPFVMQPVFDACEGRLFSRWNWNRMTSAQALDGVPQLTEPHREALELFDQIVRREDIAYSMWLQPGEIQIVNSHTTLHSRTAFVDHEDPAQKRLLYRLWLAPPDSVRLPDSWRDLYRSVEPGSVRGGIRGLAYDARRAEFERHQAQHLGMAL
jgi:alpha-ketoglutarate-dependent taurine dioxygenase